MSIWDYIPIPERYWVNREHSNKINYPPYTDIRSFCDRDCDFLIPSAIYYSLLIGFTTISFVNNPTTNWYYLCPFVIVLGSCYYQNLKASFFLRSVAHIEVRQYNAIPPQVIACYRYRIVNIIFLLCCLAFIPMNLEIIMCLDARIVFLLGACSIPSIVYNIWGSICIQQYGKAVIWVLQQQWNEQRIARAAAILFQEMYEAEIEQLEMAEHWARSHAEILLREPPPSYDTGMMSPNPDDFEDDYVYENGGFRAESPPPDYRVVEIRDSDDDQEGYGGQPNVIEDYGSDDDSSNSDDDNDDKDDGEEKDVEDDKVDGDDKDEEDYREEPVEVIVISY